MQALADDGHEWVTFMNNGKNRWLALRAIPHKSVWWFKIVRWERSHATQTCVPPQAMLKRDLWIPAPITMQTFKESGYELCRLTGSQYLIDWMISLLRRDRNASRHPHADINGFTRRYSWLLIWIGVKIWKTPECLSMFTPRDPRYIHIMVSSLDTPWSWIYHLSKFIQIRILTLRFINHFEIILKTNV